MVNISIILVSPQMGENIGASARAMKNFGITDLRIVAPRDGWPNDKARANAALAVDVIDNAKIYNDLKSAVFDIECLYATSSQVRSMNKEYITTTNLGSEFNQKMSVGIIFGRESTGLTNEEISIADKIIVIDTDPSCSSLNLSQAVLLVCYELFQGTGRSDIENLQDLASKQDILYFLDHLFSELDSTYFFKTPEKRKNMVLNITNIFSRIEKLSHNEVQTLRGIVSSLSKKHD